jgi:hypothetical protein
MIKRWIVVLVFFGAVAAVAGGRAYIPLVDSVFNAMNLALNGFSSSGWASSVRDSPYPPPDNPRLFLPLVKKNSILGNTDDPREILAGQGEETSKPKQ